ncbi:hypothetical protein [Actinomadura kijaniata]|uniref:hypothetical protein n=1 Tax=Actinomadura kijaniata TaxID=46161 RepID=UPI00082B3854|nr:hypothetical protein [Actinomadura kijaniata]
MSDPLDQALRALEAAGARPRCEECDTGLGNGTCRACVGHRLMSRAGTPHPLGGTAEVIVQVASYFLATGLGGIIGNRADAGAVALFKTVHQRWRTRTSQEPEEPDRQPLTREEAIDLAKAAAQMYGYSPEDMHPEKILYGPEDGSWFITLRAMTLNGRCSRQVGVRVPSGDPLRAVVYLQIPARRRNHRW